MSEKETRRVRKGAYANGSGSRAQRRAAAQRGRLHIEWIRAEEKDESSSAKQRAPRSRAQQRAEERRKRQGKVVLALAAAIVVLLALCGWHLRNTRAFRACAPPWK